ncbi:diguanylate cyclase [Ruminococcaceae bacterium OttesenSCG-928-O06]|nr:diguanylate cyclase [Ruminococcaceae bacterium OttesenSCG-928-O06]
MNLHLVTLFLAGINVSMLIVQFVQYVRFYRQRIPALNYCLILLLVAIVYAVLTIVTFLLPEGETLDLFVSLLLCISLWVNTFFMLIVFTLTGASNDSLLRFRRIFFYIPAVFTLLFVTNGLHNWVVTSVTKQPDGFFYDTSMTWLTIPVFAYSFLLSAVAVVRVFRSGSKGLIQTPRIRWILLFSTTLPFMLTVLESLVPILDGIGISYVANWVPIAILSYLFFGYLHTARRMAINIMDDAYVVFDLRGNCLDINREGMAFFEAYAGTDHPCSAQLAALIQQENLPREAAVEIELENEQQMITYYRISSFQLSYGMNQYCGNGYIIREVTEYRRRMNQLNTLATEDALTGAKNRRFLQDYGATMLEQARAAQYPITLLMLDIDFFKRVNDIYGHVAGDEILAVIYQIFKNNVRDDDLVVRYGGEEFLIISERADDEDGQHMAERIRKAVEHHVFKTSEGDISITVSIGVCTRQPADEVTLEQMVDKADQYLYQAKANGRNRVEMQASD